MMCWIYLKAALLAALQEHGKLPLSQMCLCLFCKLHHDLPSSSGRLKDTACHAESGSTCSPCWFIDVVMEWPNQ
jgi:hypothetical protein